MGWKCIGVGLPPLQQGSAHSSKAFLFLQKTMWLLKHLSVCTVNLSICVCTCKKKRGRKKSVFYVHLSVSVKGRWLRDSCPCSASPLLFHVSLFFPSPCCYWRSSPSSSSWMTWMSSEGEVGRLAGRFGRRPSGCCCLLISLLFSSSSMVFIHTLWFSVRCCMMLQNNLRRFFLLSAKKTQLNVMSNQDLLTVIRLCMINLTVLMSLWLFTW